MCFAWHVCYRQYWAERKDEEKKLTFIKVDQKQKRSSSLAVWRNKIFPYWIFLCDTLQLLHSVCVCVCVCVCICICAHGRNTERQKTKKTKMNIKWKPSQLQYHIILYGVFWFNSVWCTLILPAKAGMNAHSKQCVLLYTIIAICTYCTNLDAIKAKVQNMCKLNWSTYHSSVSCSTLSCLDTHHTYIIKRQHTAN